MHLAPLIIDLAIILGIAGFMSFVFHRIHQPVVLGYIMAGVICGPFTPGKFVTDLPSIQTWAELGVIFLMFTLGLEFSFRKLLSSGLTAVISVALEVVFFLTIGFNIGQWLGWSSIDSMFLGAMLCISSTTIIIKALEELKLKNHRFVNLIFGILIVEDLVAVLLLVGLTTVATSGSVSFVSLLSAAINLLIVVGGWFITGYFVIPRAMKLISRRGNNEIITLVSIGLCLLLVVLASNLGYSPALGAFIMGSILAETEIIERIEELTKPLKDLFGAIFFVSIGMLIDPQVIWEYKGLIVLICLVIILGKSIIPTLGSIISGQSFKSSIQVGMSLTQIGEFSFIIAGLGLSLNAISNKLYPIAVAVSLVTTFTTPYFIKYSSKVADTLEALLPEKIKQLLNRYMIWSEYHRNGVSKNKDVYLLIARWLVNGIMVTVIFNTSFHLLTPYVVFKDESLNRWSNLFTWLITLLISSPFIWGMIFTSKKDSLNLKEEKNILKAVIIFLFPVLTAIWIGVLSTKYFSIRYILPITSLIIVGVYLSLYRKLESYYKWMERTFLETFETKKGHEQPSYITSLAPWDNHLVNIVVHPNAQLVKKNLIEAQLRHKYGINVVAIKRGAETIVTPKPSELILPGDTLVVLGTDEKLDEVRLELEAPEVLITSTTSNYRLRQFKLSHNSPIVGLTIRESGVREKYHAIVVGVERNHARTINPNINFQMQADDILWVVGDNTNLESLLTELS